MRRVLVPVTTVVLSCAPQQPSPLPTALTVAKTDWSPVTSFLDSAVAAGAAPGAVLGVTVDGNRFVYAAGRLERGGEARTEPSTIYDLASLTKVVALTTAVMLAIDDGRLGLDQTVQRHVPAFEGEGKDRVSIRMLLAHAGGLPGWRPLFREAGTRAEAFALVNRTPLEAEPGTVTIYSDLGMILLTQVVERAYGERLDSLLERRIFQPLGMTSVGFLPATDPSRIAPTELDTWRGRLLRGEVHDENAARLDGVSGHAGLFGSVPDLLTFAEWVLRPTAGPNVSPATVRQFTRRQDLVPGSSRALGWDTPSAGSSAGSHLSPASFGHVGFTGTSLWIDPERRLGIVLLSNRVHPTRENARWLPVRSAIADLVVTTLFEDAR